MRVRLVAVGPDDALCEAALRLRTAPEQARFALVPAQSFPLAFAEAARTAFVVVESGREDDDGGDDDGDDGGDDGAGRVVGAGLLDAAAPASDAELGRLLTAAGHDPARAVLLRSFVIGADHQGRGLGTAAARAARSLAQQVAGAGVVVLTVNEQNHAGLRAYPRAGFTDVGRYLGGDAGPQRAMVARCG